MKLKSDSDKNFVSIEFLMIYHLSFQAMNKKLNKDFLRRLPLDLRQDEYVTCVQLCDVIVSHK